MRVCGPMVVAMRSMRVGGSDMHHSSKFSSSELCPPASILVRPCPSCPQQSDIGSGMGSVRLEGNHRQCLLECPFL